MITVTTSWFNWLIGFNYAALGGTAINLEIARSNKIGAAFVALVFMVNNILGIVWLLHVRNYALAVGKTSTPTGVIPAKSYAFAAGLMSLTCLGTFIVWCGSLILLVS